MADLNLDLAVLRMLKDRKKHDRYAKMIPPGTVSESTAKFIKRFGEFFAQTEAQRITYDEFWPWLRTQYPKWKDRDVEYWSAATRPIDKDNPVGFDESVIRNLMSTALANAALKLIERWNDGEEVELELELRSSVEAFEDAINRRVKTADVELDWDHMIEEEANNEGLGWRLTCVARHLRALRGGDFGILAMRPDRGKTTWGAAEITHFAPQLVLYEWSRGRPILWLNNEGPGRRILARIRQAALGMSNSEIRALGAEKAKRMFAEAVGGDPNVIIVKDIHGFTNWEVEELIRKINPAVVVFDMIDNIQFSGSTMNHGERTDQVLEAMYQWARSLGVKYDFVGLAMSQISATADGERWPAQPHLKDSRTGKQGACDFILTGGFDPSMPNTRFIGTTKNKIKVEGASGNPMCQVFFDADRARLREPEEG